MDKMNYPRGLVRYASENSLAGGKTQVLRPRLLGYATTLTVMIGALIWALNARTEVSLDVAKDRTMFRENSQGQIENSYNLKVINKTQQPQRYALSLDDGARFQLQGAEVLQLAAGEMRNVAVSVALLGAPAAQSPEQLRFHLHDTDDASSAVSTASTFVAPRQR